MNLVRLARSKANCLIRFLEVSESFLAQIKQGNFQELDQVQVSRDSILKAIELFDRKIREQIDLQKGKISASEKDQLNQIISHEEDLLKIVRRVDHQILKLIEEESEAMGSQIAQTEKSKKIIRRFKSHWAGEQGSSLDRVL